LAFLGKIALDAVRAIIKLQVDLKLYNTMMGRDVNFRPTDLSSVFNNPDPNRYFKRLFRAGDGAVMDRIHNANPILNIATHNLLPFSEPIFSALGDKCCFVEIVRHPLYMVRQQSLNFAGLTESVRHFTVYHIYEGRLVPYYARGWEEAYLASTPMERSIHFIDQMTRRSEGVRKFLRDSYGARIITIPFEPFVLAPYVWLHKLAEFAGTKVGDATDAVMRGQNIPRLNIAQGIDVEIYRRCGWTPPIDGATERDELRLRYEDVRQNSNEDALRVMDQLIENYEHEYWSPDETQ